ncbi:cytochrome c [Roseomonas sp. AR75]|uniref:SorU family sulfite dehydrogenase c-type cytochrome subunit n=1 Tax=Roseomonas sp. AR75 TaxID=2562311 RepID=UPI001980ECE3|nr:cytochrome c [Roseomonas sp. AR75]
MADSLRRAALAVALGLAASGAAAQSGRDVFTAAAQPNCAVCHTLAAADAAGEIGPSLDALKPSAERVRRAVTEGPGTMPAYADTLSAAQIEAVARFVAESAGG